MYIDRESCLYVLITELNLELDKFMRCGKSELRELNALPEADEEELVKTCSNLGYDVSYQSHRLEYMWSTISIKCLKVRNPDTGVSISLIPWFISRGRPYPIHVYIYAIWYYHQHGKKSMEETARVCGKLWGIESFHKSTVSRSIKAMESVIDIAQIDRSLAVSYEGVSHEAREIAKTCVDPATLATEILKNCPSPDLLEDIYQDEIQPLPETINRKVTVEDMLSGISEEHGQIVIHDSFDKRITSDTRKRPGRPGNKKQRPVQRYFRFVENARLEKIRAEFIENCRHIVLDAAVTYHRFLI